MAYLPGEVIPGEQKLDLPAFRESASGASERFEFDLWPEPDG